MSATALVLQQLRNAVLRMAAANDCFGAERPLIGLPIVLSFDRLADQQIQSGVGGSIHHYQCALRSDRRIRNGDTPDELPVGVQPNQCRIGISINEMPVGNCLVDEICYPADLLDLRLAGANSFAELQWPGSHNDCGQWLIPPAPKPDAFRLWRGDTSPASLPSGGSPAKNLHSTHCSPPPHLLAQQVFDVCDFFSQQIQLSGQALNLDG